MVDRLPIIESRAVPGVTRLPGVPAAAATQTSRALAQVGQSTSRLAIAADTALDRSARRQEIADEKAARERERQRQNRIKGFNTEAVATLSEKWARDFQEGKQSAPSGAAGFLDQFGGSMQEDVEGFVGQIPEDDEEGRVAVRDRLTRLRTTFIGPASGFEAAEQLRHRTEQTGKALTNLANLAVSDPDQYRAYLAEGRQAIADSDLTAEGKDRARASFDENLTAAVLDVEARDDPNGLIERLGEGEFDELITPQIKTRGLRAAEVEQDRRKREAEAAQKAQAKLLEEQQEQQAAVSKVASGFGVDDQKEADKAWQAIMQEASGGDPERAQEFTTPENITKFAAAAGFVPSGIDHVLASAERVQSPQLLADAARLQGTIATGAPGVKTKGGDRIEMTLQLAQLAGVELQDAATQVINNLPDPKTREIRQAEFNALKLDPVKEAQSTALAQGGGFLGFFGFGEAEVPPELAGEFEDSMRLLYEMSGDVDTSRETAAGLLQKEWGRSTISGQEELTRHPPERFAPPAAANLSSEQFASVLRDDIQDQLEAVAIPVGETAFTLRADAGTQSALERGELPSWLVMVENDFGAMVPLRIEQTGELLRYQLPTNQEFQQLAGFEAVVGPAEASLADLRRQRVTSPFTLFNAPAVAGTLGEQLPEDGT
ncbi:MAG: hypothetical protein ACR2P3_06690 [Geminicoccaceae bacterium]